MPKIFDLADALSVTAQQRSLRAMAARLILAVGAGVLAALGFLWTASDIEWLTLGAAAALVGAVGVEVWLMLVQPENDWYDGRAVAESSKTLAWRFAVGGLPFPVGCEDPESAFADQLKDLLLDARDLKFEAGESVRVTTGMSDLRSESLNTRREAYVEGRVIDQETWYSLKALYNSGRTTLWRFILISFELAGVAAATAKGFGWIKVDIAGIATAAIGAGAAWLAVKQHESVGRAYAFAANELGIVRGRITAVTDEQTWAVEVASAEGAISREHTMWRAARVTPLPAVKRHRYRYPH